MGPQSKHLGSPLRAEDFNYMVDSINRVVGSGPIGYFQDQLVVEQLNLGDDVTDARWRELLLAVSSAAKHQGYTMTGPTSLQDPAFDDFIPNIVRNINADISVMISDWFTHEPSQMVLENTTATKYKTFGNPITGLDGNEEWNENRWYGFRAKFASDDDMLGFFNAGGEIRFTPTLENHEVSHQNSSEWNTLLNTIGTISFSSLGMTGGGAVAFPFHVNPIDGTGNPVINLEESYYWNPGTFIPSYKKQVVVWWRVWEDFIDILIRFSDYDISTDQGFVVGDLTVTVEQYRAQADPEIEPDYSIHGVISPSPMFTTNENFTIEPLIDPDLYSNIRIGDFSINADTLDGIDSTQLMRTDQDTIMTVNTTWVDGVGIYLGTDKDFYMRFDGTNTKYTILNGDLHLTDGADIQFIFDSTTNSLTTSGDVTAYG